jgi:multicomponent Na+:H+ antiporter subunit C
LRRGLPPIVLDKSTFTGDISQFVDPLPQALILTAIVISFGITAFIIALLNRRHSLEQSDERCSERTDDPFGLQPREQLQEANDDYEWLEDIVVRRQSGGVK